jgi:hypothetical protein
MSIAIQINATNTAGPASRRVMSVLKPSALNPVIGRSANNTVREHLFGLNSSRPNKLGGRRTNFYGQAARATNFKVVSDTEVVVSIPKLGIAQRFFGGTIRPKAAKYLTIPANPAAHGKRAREFSDLKFAIIPGKGPALVLKSAIKVKRVKTKQTGRTRRDDFTSETLTTSGGETTVMFWLRRSITQQPDPTVLPYNELIASRVQRDVDAVITGAINGSGNAGGAKP